ncbi:MAG: substrate-binding domain-containing protein [Kiritimatiellae bacterium]|nr:substrate-binding domain-containing protein [Kiritimatiellia bacterium]
MRNASYKSVRKVAVAIKLSNASWRDFLTGFFNYAKRSAYWDIRVIQSVDELERALPGCHGVVTGMEPNRRIQSMLASSGIPLVAVGAEWRLDRRIKGVACIRNDNRDIGLFCARYFLTLGAFASAGFIPSSSEDDWSIARQRGFLGGFDGVERSVFGGTEEPGSDGDIAMLAGWLKSLPKPAAVMAAWDGRAVHALTACRIARLKVPGQVSVIGVDDDRLLCDFTTPPMTSIAPDHALEGHIAAKTLDRMMRGVCRPNVGTAGRDGARRILNTAKKIVERESARPISPVTSLIARALAFIGDHAAESIKAEDVARALGVSRSLLDLRFREFRNETVAKAITGRRLDEVKRFLADTSLSIRAISVQCGFANPNHLKNLFKRHLGTSMREWRRSRIAPGVAGSLPRSRPSSCDD